MVSRVIASGPVPAVRILLDYRPALRQRTGVGEYVHETATALAASAPASESLVLFSSSWKDRVDRSTAPRLPTIDRRVPVRLLNLAWHRLGWPAVEGLAGPDFDVVHATSPLLIPSRRAARLVTIYDLDFLDAPERTSAEIRRDYPALAATHARRADQVVVISAHTAHDVEHRLGVPVSHISICPPGAPAWPRRAEEPAGDGCLLFVGTLEPRKNLGVLLDAYARLASARAALPPLVLAGRIPPSADGLVRRTQEPPLAGRVLLPGYVSEREKIEWFRRALVFVLPSHAEGFGIAAVEALKVGVPVVAASRGALPEVLGPAARLVDPDDPAGLAVALAALLDDPAERRRLVEVGWRHVERFTWARTAAGMRQAWQLALDHRARSRG
jgi:glycosyltransferase involved in cell wall biosynthesis